MYIYIVDVYINIFIYVIYIYSAFIYIYIPQKYKQTYQLSYMLKPRTFKILGKVKKQHFILYHKIASLLLKDRFTVLEPRLMFVDVYCICV